jgi:NADH-quinone oxidoreductase subunit M
MVTSVMLSDSVGFPVLTTMTLVPLITLGAVIYSRSSAHTMWAGLVGGALNVALSLFLLLKFDDNFTGTQFAESFSVFGLSYSVGVDGLSILFVPLVACIALLVLVYISATKAAGNKQLIAAILGYEAILMAAFCALNLLQFWFLTALELLPIIWVARASGLGSKKRFMVVRLLQYFGASLFLTLCGFMLLAFGLVDSEHELTFDLLTLANNNAYLHDETLIFILLFYGFAIRLPLFPFHGWLPLLAEQNGLTSMAVFVIGLKLGVYAMIRFIFPLVPGVAEQWANFALTLSLISIFYGAILAFMQNNAYRLLAFATISQTGMLVYGLFSFNEHGLEGALLLALVYGLASVGMLFSIGLINEQTNTRMIPRLGNLFDSHTALAMLFLIATLSTVIMPGSLGFDAGHLLLEGVIEEHEWGIAVTILTGHVLAAGFLLWAFQRIFLAHSKRHAHPASHAQALFQERLIAFVICALHIGTGLNSMPLLDLVDQDAEALVNQYPMHSSQQGQTEANTPDPDGQDTAQ